MGSPLFTLILLVAVLCLAGGWSCRLAGAGGRRWLPAAGSGSGPLGLDQVGQPAHLALDRLDRVPLELGDVAVGARRAAAARARSSRSWSRERRPSRIRSRTPASVREKNANRMLKSSSSQAAGPASVISRGEELGAGRRDLVDDPLAAGDPGEAVATSVTRPGAQHPLQRGVERAVGEQPGPAEQQVQPLAQLVAVQRGVVQEPEDGQLEGRALARHVRLLPCRRRSVVPVCVPFYRANLSHRYIVCESPLRSRTERIRAHG